MSLNREPPILLVEDSEADARVTTRALTRAGLSCPIVLCRDGDQALEYLYHRAPGEVAYETPRPAIILLDLNMPGSDGRYVLQQIKNHPNLKTIPVIVLTTSDNQSDIDICYQYGANSYVKKPADLADFMTSMSHLVAYWFHTNLAP
ncbi:response regulator [Candidatus Entotheonella palauensis]|uniref:response regulator n=1 Tax=Candidatus Entotheonella palauensis TaxID=93172 RepID=UPI000B7D70FF|nr:response regulator [Candidatus Entotheonella palauensis]